MTPRQKNSKPRPRPQRLKYYCPLKERPQPLSTEGGDGENSVRTLSAHPHLPRGAQHPPTHPPYPTEERPLLFLLVHAPPGASSPPAAGTQHVSRALSTSSSAAATRRGGNEQKVVSLPPFVHCLPSLSQRARIASHLSLPGSFTLVGSIQTSFTFTVPSRINSSMLVARRGSR